MKGSAEERASGNKKSGWEDTVLTWGIAHRMLILVQPIVKDVLHHQQRAGELVAEKERLDRRRLQLTWPQRARRYEIQEEIDRVEQKITETRSELERLGVALLSPDKGEVGFPTLVNDRRAFFVWNPAEEDLQHWQFVGESVRRPIPPAWIHPPEEKVTNRKK